MGGMSIWHWVVVAVVVMLLFGRGKISEMMGDVAKGIKAFKKGMADEEESQKTGTSAGNEPVRTIPHQSETAPTSAQQSPADRKMV